MPPEMLADRKRRISIYILGLITELEGRGVRREGLLDTPDRAAQYWMDVTAGNQQRAEDIMKVFEDGADKVDQLVFQGNIPFFSHCEHHLCPFFGVAHIAYIPGRPELRCNDLGVLAETKQKILGLSKFARLLEIFTRRLQVQERITTQVVDALVEHLRPQGAACVIRARHLCMECRGVEKIGTITMTSALRGAFIEDSMVRSEFMQFVAIAENRAPNI